MMPTYEVRVLEVAGCGPEILTLRLDRPEGYEFRAGQWLRLTVQTAEGAEVRTLSHAACPDDGWIEVTTRRSDSAFKQALAALVPGDTVEVSASAGRFTLPGDDTFAVLVGGVGITPIRSMLREAVAEGRRFGDALVVYGNRDVSCEPYIDELLALLADGVRIVRVLEHPPAGWKGESGFITADIVRRHLAKDDGRPFVISGPPPMVEAMTTVLDQMGIDASRRHIEAFGSLRKQTDVTRT